MKVLLVEDDEQVSRFIARGLRESGHTVDLAADGGDGLFHASHERYDVIVMDRRLPGLEDGLAIVEALRKSGNPVPILVLSALADVEERIRGLKSGADDYLGKPFAFGELLARLDALYRRASGGGRDPRLAVGDLELYPATRKVARGGRDIVLPPREFKLLEYLMRHAGCVVTRSMLLENVWEYDFDPQANVVDALISKLRQKIQQAGERPLLKTVRNAGYLLSADPPPRSQAAPVGPR